MTEEVRVNVSQLLQAPCIFCDYNGEGYWQKETHDERCPWHSVGGMEDRRNELGPLIHDMAKAWMQRP